MARDGRQLMITLMGPKHVGKTSVGKALARSAGGIFLDLDAVIEKRTGSSPRTLYERGPEVFREAEAEAAAWIVGDASASMTTVIAAGGGLIDNPSALGTLRERSILVYLELDPEKAWERIRDSSERSGSLPPFLRGEDPKGIHRTLHERRARAYRNAADITVDAAKGSPAEIAALVREELGRSRVGRA